MRDAFAVELHAIAGSDPRVLAVVGDTGFGVFDRFIEDYPDRFINMGVAEGNMIGAAAGLSIGGKIPIVYAIVPFLTMRAFEQIRNDICIQNLPVKIVGVGGGLAYGQMGPTHHSIVDMAILRALPNMTVLSPCDPMESKKAFRAAYEHDGPVYVRLGRNGEPPLHTEDYHFEIGKAVQMRPGADATIISTGAVTGIALNTADALAGNGINVRVLNVHTLKPIDTESIVAAAQETRAMVTIEEHNVIGGLGSAVSEVIAEHGTALPFKRIGIPDTFSYGVGSQNYHLARHGVSVEEISKTLLTMLETGKVAVSNS